MWEFVLALCMNPLWTGKSIHFIESRLEAPLAGASSCTASHTGIVDVLGY